MSLNSLKIATDGYLKRTTKAVLVIAVAGYLNYGGTPPTPPSGGGGGGQAPYTWSNRTHEDEEKRKLEEQIKTENQDLLDITYILCQIL